MAVERGFDIFPRLNPDTVDREKYSNFVTEIVETYEGQQQRLYNDNKDKNYKLGNMILFPGESPDSHKTNIVFLAGDRPGVPVSSEFCGFFLRFSSTVPEGNSDSVDRCVEEMIKLAWKHFGRDRVHFWKGLRAEEQGKYTREMVADVEKELLACGAGKVWINKDGTLVRGDSGASLEGGQSSKP